MSSTSYLPLTTLYSRLTEWIAVSEFKTILADYFHGPRTAAELADLRARRGALKKLSDEVTPILHHIQFTKAKGEIRFTLNDQVPDCWFREHSSSQAQGIEVTVAQGRERHLLGKELNEKGRGRGFLGLPDDAPSEAFSKKLAHGRVMYSTDQALKVITAGIKSCLEKKKKQKYAGLNLLIDAPLRSLPRQRWSVVEDELRSAAAGMPFHEIHVIGNQDDCPFGLRIK
jgi:hypothetical protein